MSCDCSNYTEVSFVHESVKYDGRLNAEVLCRLPAVSDSISDTLISWDRKYCLQTTYTEVYLTRLSDAQLIGTYSVQGLCIVLPSLLQGKHHLCYRHSGQGNLEQRQ